MSVSVCLFVCRLAYLKITVQTSRYFLYVFSEAVARRSLDDTGVRYVLPVLWQTSCFPIMARGVASIDVGAVLKRVLKIINVFGRRRHAV